MIKKLVSLKAKLLYIVTCSKTIVKGESMQSVIVNRPEIKLIGIELETTNRDNLAMQEIPPFWQKFLSQNTLEKIPNKVDPNQIIAVYTKYKNETDYSMIIGAAVSTFDDIPEEMTTVTLPAGKYAAFNKQGDIEENVTETWQYIWSPDFKHERSFIADYEVYHQKQSVIDGSGLVDIYVGIK